MWEIVFDLKGTSGLWVSGCTHSNFATHVGPAVFAFHQWIQHSQRVPRDDYRVTGVNRLLRGRDIEGRPAVAGHLPIEDWPRGNPETPPIHALAPVDATATMAFLAEVPTTPQPATRKKRAT